MDPGNPSQDRRMNYANSDKLWQFWLQPFGTNNSSLANAKIFVSLYSFCFVLFWICKQFPSISPGGFYLEEFTYGGANFRNFTYVHFWKTYSNSMCELNLSYCSLGNFCMFFILTHCNTILVTNSKTRSYSTTMSLPDKWKSKLF